MADFNSIGRLGQPLRPERVDDRQAPAPGQPTQDGSNAINPSAVTARDEVLLSAAAVRESATETFDAERVANIRKAIEEGNYPLDARRIAEDFTALEQLINSR